MPAGVEKAGTAQVCSHCPAAHPKTRLEGGNAQSHWWLAAVSGSPQPAARSTERRAPAPASHVQRLSEARTVLFVPPDSAPAQELRVRGHRAPSRASGARGCVTRRVGNPDTTPLAHPKAATTTSLLTIADVVAVGILGMAQSWHVCLLGATSSQPHGTWSTRDSCPLSCGAPERHGILALQSTV